MSEICPACKVDLVVEFASSVCPNEIAKEGPWCPIRYRYNNISGNSYISIRVMHYLIVMDDSYFHIKTLTGGCNEFDGNPVFSLSHVDTKSLFNFSDVESIENQIKLWLAFS